MKYLGEKLDAPTVEVIVIPRQTGDIVFKAAAILDYSNFEKMCPQPEPPESMVPGGGTQQDIEDPKYNEHLNEWAERKSHWMILKSLQSTEDLEWETVDMAKPETWKNYAQELRDAHFTDYHINQILNIAITVNGLDQSKIDEATKSFLAGQLLHQNAENSPSSEQKGTGSGEPAKD